MMLTCGTNNLNNLLAESSRRSAWRAVFQRAGSATGQSVLFGAVRLSESAGQSTYSSSIRLVENRAAIVGPPRLLSGRRTLRRSTAAPMGCGPEQVVSNPSRTTSLFSVGPEMARPVLFQPYTSTALGKPVGGIQIDGQVCDMMVGTASPAAIKMAFSQCSEFSGQRTGSRSRVPTYVPVHNGTEQKGQSRFSGRAPNSYMLQSPCQGLRALA